MPKTEGRSNVRRAKARPIWGRGSTLAAQLLLVASFAAVAVGPSGCVADMGPVEPESQAPAYVFDLPPGFPAPRVPADNPMSEEKVQLGRHLFYDERLSGNGTMSCASCHEQDKAFADAKPVAEGSTGEFHTLGAMSLTNAGYASTLGWANPVLRILEDQAVVPMFGETPIELGITNNEDAVLERLRAEPIYAELFADAFPDFEAENPGEDLINFNHIVMALSSFQRTLISGRSPYDRWLQDGDESALDGQAQFGREIFFSERADCFHCHGGVLFSDSLTHEGTVFDETPFHNNGLYNLDEQGRYPANQGLFEITAREEDIGRFKAPTLRNIAVTAPYMHDGSIETLGGVLDMYARGGRLIREGENAGDGRDHPNKSGFVHGFVMTPEERFALLAFLEALTDDEFLTDERHSNPW